MGAGDLAELLRELKGRSGLSYGALAKRLHVSTSTLHRYVNGTAVPTEFAPVERLARLCKATPDELMEVHRRWIVADATRGRKAEPEPVREAGATPEPEPERAPEPEPVPTEPEPEPVPVEPEPVSEPETELEVARPHEPRPKSRLSLSLSQSLSRGKRQRLGALAAVGVVLAVAGTALAVHSASGSSGGGDGKHAAADDTPRPDTARSPSGTAKKQPSGRPSLTSSAKPPEKDEDKQDGGRTKSGPRGGSEGSEGRAPGAGGEASGGGSGRAPLTVSTQPQYWDNECGRPYLINRPPDRLPSPPTPQDAAGWVSAFDAVSAESHDVKFTVQGTGKETVVLESLNIRVVGRSDPPAWNKYLMGFLGVGCGGNVPKHSFNAKLDHGRPALVPEGDDFPYKVSEKDPETFYVLTTAKSRYVRWYLELEWSSGTRHGTVVINDEGKPFRTSGAPDDHLFGYTLEGREWVKAWRRPNGEDGYEWEGR
ncbi:helix-turn-helix transcriptional regulator [Streptomyces spectabilis]|uniref:helix-turn-helix domain-containing protein n=1 Tax=Streptomyces spectabilis TaxID=68270 RepID=UPI0033CE64FD